MNGPPEVVVSSKVNAGILRRWLRMTGSIVSGLTPPRQSLGGARGRVCFRAHRAKSRDEWATADASAEVASSTGLLSRPFGFASPAAAGELLDLLGRFRHLRPLVLSAARRQHAPRAVARMPAGSGAHCPARLRLDSGLVFSSDVLFSTASADVADRQSQQLRKKPIPDMPWNHLQNSVDYRRADRATPASSGAALH